MPARTFAKALSSLSVWQLEAPTLAGMRRCARWSPELLSECDCLPDRPSSLIPLFSPSRRRLQPDPAHVPLASRSCPARVPLMSRSCPARVPLVSRSCPGRRSCRAEQSLGCTGQTIRFITSKHLTMLMNFSYASVYKRADSASRVRALRVGGGLLGCLVCTVR